MAAHKDSHPKRPLPSQAPVESEVRLCLLGTFQVERAGERLALYSHKVEALLAYLALQPQEHSREKLAALFWGDSTDEQARLSLRVGLNSLRKQIPGDLLFADRESVRLNPVFPLWVDSHAFLSVVNRSVPRTADPPTLDDLLTAVGLYRGDLLLHFYDDWIFPLRDQFRELYLGALLLVVEQYRAQSEYTHAIEFAQRVLATEGANEAAHQHLMFCYSVLGERAAALKQYDACKRALRDELVVEPSKETQALYESIKKKLETSAPAARLTNLPRPLTSFIGRAEQLQSLKLHLEQGTLVTLTGAGGSGKTRLAIEAGRELLSAYSEGVWWVDLSALSEPALLPQQVAKALGVPEQPGQDLGETLINYLRVRQLLLVIDNCEHLIDACATLVEILLTQCERLHVLATSREALGVPGEMLWQVPTLAVPLAPELSQFLMQYDGIRLFVERARAVQNSFALSDQNAPAVVQICRRLDGLPLAIELAAARVKQLSVEQITQRLDDRFGLLTGGSRTALPRHQTLRAMIDWGYGLLSEPERTVLRRLSVFAGGCTLEAAETIMDDPAPGAGNAPPAASKVRPLFNMPILDLLGHLAEKSMVNLDRQSDAEPRYRLLETIRQYAREKLEDQGESEFAHARHLEYFTQFAQTFAPRLHGIEQQHWAERLDTENDNLRAALEWARTEGRIEKGLRLVVALTWFWEFRGYFREGRAHVEGLLARPEAAPATLARAGALLTATWMTVGLRDSLATRKYGEELITIARTYSLDGQAILAVGLNHLADVIDEDDTERARALRAESWSLSTGLGDPWTLAWLLYRKVFWLFSEKDFLGSHQAADESLRLFRAVGDRRYETMLLFSIGETYFHEGNIAAARAHFEQSLALARRAGDREGLMGALNDLGEIARLEGNDEEAAQFYSDALQAAQELGIDGALQMWNLGVLVLHTGDYGRAKSLLSESLLLHRAKGRKVHVLLLLDALAGLAAAVGQPVRAARLFGAAEHLKKSSAASIAKFESPADRAERQGGIDNARAHLDEGAFQAAWAEGYEMTLEQAVAEALSVKVEPIASSRPYG